MEIENKNRAPTVRNIQRDAPETQTDTGMPENLYGIKTDTPDGIRSVHESGSHETRYKPEEDADDSDDAKPDTGTAPGHREQGFRIPVKSALFPHENPVQAVPEDIFGDIHAEDILLELLETDDEEPDTDEDAGTEEQAEEISENEAPDETDDAQNDDTDTDTDAAAEAEPNPESSDTEQEENEPETEEQESKAAETDTPPSDEETEPTAEDESNTEQAEADSDSDDSPEDASSETPDEDHTDLPEDSGKEPADVPKNNDPAPGKAQKCLGLKAPAPDQLKRKKFIIAAADSDGSAVIEMGQTVTGAAETMVQTRGTIRTAVKSSAGKIGRIVTAVNQGIRLGTAKDAGIAAAHIGSGIRTGITNAAAHTGTSLLKTKIDKSVTTDTGTEAVKQGLTELRYADNARKALQNTARGSIKAACTVKNIPRETKAQIQRIKKKARLIKQGAKKTASIIRKLMSAKAGKILAAGLLLHLLFTTLLNSLLTVIISAAASLFSWMAPDGDTAERIIQKNIRTYISQIEDIEAEKQGEVNGIADSLTPEYRNDGSQITGLNRFGNKTIAPYDNYAVLAMLAMQKYRDVQDTGSVDFHFTENEIRTAVDQFYTLNYHYEYSWCPGCDCSKESDCVLSFADRDFEISDTSYDAGIDRYTVKLTGSTYAQASSLFTRLDFRMTGGGSITGSGEATVRSGTWTKRYRIEADAYNRIDWSKCYLTVDTVYCNNSNHKYLYGQVVNLTEAQVLTKAGFTADEKQIFQAYLEQIRAIGG